MFAKEHEPWPKGTLGVVDDAVLAAAWIVRRRKAGDTEAAGGLE